MASTIQLQTTVNQARLGVGQSPLAGLGGFTDQPALTWGDEVRNFLLSPPFAWRWNRQVLQFTTVAGQQDYTFAPVWRANFSYNLYTLVTDSNGSVQQVTTAGTSGATAPVWNAAVGGTTTDNTVGWTNIGGAGQSIGLPDFGWVELASVNDGTEVVEMEMALDLGTTLSQELPTMFSARLDDGQGGISFRIFPAPFTTYTVNLSYQKASPKFVNLTDTWFPIPDYFSFLYTIGFRAKAYEYKGDERFPTALQLFLKETIAANEGLSDSQKNIFLDHKMNTARELQSLQKGGQ